MSRLSRRRPALALAQPATAVELQSDTRRVLERRDRESGRLERGWQKEAADGAAGTTTAETVVWSNPPTGVQRRVQAASFTPAASVVANGTNFARLRLMRRPADGSAAAHLASLTSAINPWRAWVPSALAFDGKPPLIEPGASVTFAIDKPGTGVIVPKGSLLLTLVEA